MLIEKQLEVSASEFFKVLENSIMLDIETSTGKKPGKLFNGYSYEKTMKNRMGQSGNVKVTIEEVVEPLLYKSKIYSNQGFNYIVYQIKELSERSIQVTYEESYLSDKRLNVINHKVMMKLYKKNSEKRINMMLSAMERYIIENREEVI